MGVYGFALDLFGKFEDGVAKESCVGKSRQDSALESPFLKREVQGGQFRLSHNNARQFLAARADRRHFEANLGFCAVVSDDLSERHDDKIADFDRVSVFVQGAEFPVFADVVVASSQFVHDFLVDGFLRAGEAGFLTPLQFLQNALIEVRQRGLAFLQDFPKFVVFRQQHFFEQRKVFQSKSRQVCAGFAAFHCRQHFQNTVVRFGKAAVFGLRSQNRRTFDVVRTTGAGFAEIVPDVLAGGWTVFAFLCPFQFCLGFCLAVAVVVA